MADAVSSCENRQRCTPLTKVVTSLCTGLLFCIIGLVSYATFPPILEQQVKANLVIDPANEIYESWTKAPIPIYVKMYLFNYTNHEQIINFRAKPILQQVGPFVYREYRKKVNVTFNENGTVSYRQVLSYEFLPNLTIGSLEDEVITLNVPLIGAAYKNSLHSDIESIQMGEMLQKTVDDFNQTVFIRRKVRELLFDGYRDKMMSIAKQLDLSPTDRFAYQINRNNSDDGTYTVFTGAKGMHNYGFIDHWEGKKKVAGFRKACSYISGTTGEMWPPYSITPNKSLAFFVSTLCRSLNLSFKQDETVKGIKVLRFHINDQLFNYDVEENQCYCRKKKNSVVNCFPSGVLDIHKCQHDAPIVVSLPHFLHAHSSLISAVDGLKADEDLHDFFMDVEPVMGIPVRVSARLQMNVILNKFPNFKIFDNFEQQFLPTFWLETSATVSDDMAFKIRLVTEDLANYVTFAAAIWILLGLFVLTYSLAYVISHTRKAKKQRTPSNKYVAVKLVRTAR